MSECDVKRLDDKTLQRLHDDDLSPQERERAERCLAESPEDQKRLESLGQLRSLLVMGMDHAAGQANLDGLWERVRSDVAASSRPSAWERLRLWLGDSMAMHPFRWVGAGAAAVLLAMALTFLVSSLSSPSAPEEAKPGMGVAQDQLDIEGLDFKGRHPDIYQIQEGDRSTTVIWVYPEDDEEDGQGLAPLDDGGSDDI